MTNKQPLPLKLADKVEAMQRWPAGDVTCLEVAAELRRLHEENQQWQEKCNTYIEIHDAVVKDNERLHEVNGHLLLALEKLARLGNEPFYGNSIGNQIAQAAIAKATGEQHD